MHKDAREVTARTSQQQGRAAVYSKSRFSAGKGGRVGERDEKDLLLLSCQKVEDGLKCT